MSTKLSFKTKFFFATGIAFFGLLTNLGPVAAERLESDSYVIQFGNFNMTAGEKDSASYQVTDTVGQTGAGPYGTFGSTAYFVGGGFQYIYQINEFRFTISDTNIDLGTLTSGFHNTDSHSLTITTRGANGYNIYAYELHPLRRLISSDIISDTTCDANTCDETNAEVWTNAEVGGFGFNVSGDHRASDFTDDTYFRQFANSATSEPMQVIMSSTDLANNDTGTVTFKAGLFGSETAGTYQTGVVYIAVPGY